MSGELTIAHTLERLDVAAGQGDADLVDLGALAEVLLLLYARVRSCSSMTWTGAIRYDMMRVG